jgi:hypothetical protein
MYQTIIYKSLTNPYLRLVHIGNGKIWNPASRELEATPAWADTVITLANNTYIGGVPVEIPEDLPAGEYHLLVYDSLTPAISNSIEVGKLLNWSGSGIIGTLLDA